MADSNGTTRRQVLLAATGALAASGAPAPSFQPDFASALDAAAAIRAKRISSRELTELAFRRIDRHNPKLNAIILQFRDQALTRARQADEALAHRQDWGPFHGVPITVKESFSMQGVPTTAGLPARKDFRPRRNAIAVDRLLAAGAIICGKTNVPVMLSDWQSYNPIYGSTNNPWNLDRTPGGSTGGGAAALAAGLGHLTLGSDIGGSIRVPAHFCGLFGHKPTLELVSLKGHVPPFAPDASGPAFVDLAVAGPLARSAGDLRAAMLVLGGPNGDEAKAWKWTMPAPRHTRLRDFRVGWLRDDAYCPISSEIRPALERAVQEVEKAGAQVDRGWPEDVDPGAQLDTYLFLLASVLFAGERPEFLEAQRAVYKQNPRDPMSAAVVEPSSRWLGETERRFGFRRAWQKYFETHDVFLMPVAFVPAFPHDHSEPMPARTIVTPEGPKPYMDIMKYVSFATLAGLPATVAPVGKTASGLPVGIQIVGPFLEDATPIEFAARLSEILGGFEAPKQFAS